MHNAIQLLVWCTRTVRVRRRGSTRRTWCSSRWAPAGATCSRWSRSTVSTTTASGTRLVYAFTTTCLRTLQETLVLRAATRWCSRWWTRAARCSEASCRSRWPATWRPGCARRSSASCRAGRASCSQCTPRCSRAYRSRRSGRSFSCSRSTRSASTAPCAPRTFTFTCICTYSSPHVLVCVRVHVHSVLLVVRHAGHGTHWLLRPLPARSARPQEALHCRRLHVSLPRRPHLRHSRVRAFTDVLCASALIL